MPKLRSHRARAPRRRARISLTAGVALIASLVAIPLTAATGASASGGSTTPRSGVVALGGDVLPGINRIASVGAAPADQTMNVTLDVAGENPAGEAAAYHAIYTPGSPTYHQFLTPDQIASRFGAPLGRWNATLAWLEQGGMRPTYSSPTRDVIEATGTVSAIDRLFGVSINRYHSSRVDFVANTAAPVVPASLGLNQVLGLNTLERMVPASTGGTVASAVSGLLKPAAGLLNASAGLPIPGTGENIGVQTPQDLWGAYQQPASAQGFGQSVAIFGEGQTATIISDLAKFQAAHHLARHAGQGALVPNVVQVGPGPFTDTSGNVEWNIDTQAEVGMAPQVSGLTMYFGKDLSDATVAALFSAWEGDASGPRQANASFGECEAQPVGNAIGNLLGSVLSNPNVPVGTGLTNSLQGVADQILLRATLQGKTLFAASGDTGSSCPAIVLPVVGAGNGVVNQVVPFTNYPAASPYAVGVGGTVLYTQTQGGQTTRAQEYAWTFGGGGTSFFIPAPSYQLGTPNLIGVCLVTPDGQPTNTGQPCRGVPDVSAMSGDALTNAYSIISGGQPSVGGGTSLSSPLYVGMWARVQAASSSPGGNGFANEVFYRLGKNLATESRDFTDITTGLLGVPLVGNGLYPTLPRWDYATGWGPPQVANMIQDVDHAS